ncbi:MAG: hypothetical protein WCK66_04435, partial [Betaproteobacteria bacterium]
MWTLNPVWVLLVVVWSIPLLAQTRDSDVARAKCVEFGFKERTPSHDQCVKQFLQSTGSIKATEKTALPTKPALTEAQREDNYWKEAKAIGNNEAFEGYLAIYPNGRYISLARARLTKLKESSNAQRGLAFEQLETE